MSGILDKIFADKKVELDSVKRRLALPDVKTRISDKTYEIRNIKKVLQTRKESHIIAEIKPRTPFKGELREDVNPVSIAKIYNELLGGMKGLEHGIQKKEYVLDGDLKDTMLLLHTNCKDCKEKILYHIQKLVTIISELEPTYNYLLIDLSMKNKA